MHLCTLRCDLYVACGSDLGPYPDFVLTPCRPSFWIMGQQDLDAVTLAFSQASHRPRSLFVIVVERSVIVLAVQGHSILFAGNDLRAVTAVGCECHRTCLGFNEAPHVPARMSKHWNDTARAVSKNVVGTIERSVLARSIEVDLGKLRFRKRSRQIRCFIRRQNELAAFDRRRCSDVIPMSVWYRSAQGRHRTKVLT